MVRRRGRHDSDLRRGFRCGRRPDDKPEIRGSVLFGPLSFARNETRRLPGHQLGEGDVGAGERARSAGIGELHDAGVPARDDERKLEKRRVVLLKVGLGGAVSEQACRGQVRHHEPASVAQYLCRRRSLFEREAAVCGRRTSGPGVSGDAAEPSFADEEREDAGSGPDAFGGYTGKHRQRRGQLVEVTVSRGERRRQAGRAGRL
jgi:hypothetical protein